MTVTRGGRTPWERFDLAFGWFPIYVDRYATTRKKQRVHRWRLGAGPWTNNVTYDTADEAWSAARRKAAEHPHLWRERDVWSTADPEDFGRDDDPAAKAALDAAYRLSFSGEKDDYDYDDV